MSKRFGAVLVLLMVSVGAFAEEAPNHGSGVTQNQYSAPQAETAAQREVKLIRYISACMDQGRPGAGGSFTAAPSSSTLGTSLYR